jgi:hypothetical protein
MSNLRTFVDRCLHRYVTLKGRLSHGSRCLRWLSVANVKSFALKVQFRSRRGGIQLLPLENRFWAGELWRDSTGTGFRAASTGSLIEYFSRHHTARTPSFQPIFFPSS